MLSVECSNLYVNPAIVVQLTSISVPELAVAVAPVGGVGNVHTCAVLLAGLCPIALTAYTLYEISVLGIAEFIPVCVTVNP